MLKKLCSKLESSKVVQIVLGLFIIIGLTTITYHFVIWLQSPLIYIVTDYNSSLVNSGVQKAQKEHFFEIEEYTNKDANLLFSKISSSFFGDFKKPQLIIFAGEGLLNYGKTLAANYKKTDFGFINQRSSLNYPNTEVVKVSPYGGSYLAGAAAAKKTKTEQICVLVDKSKALVDEYLAGFGRGVMATGSSADIVVEFLDQETTPREKAGYLYGQGCDVLYSVTNHQADAEIIREAENRKEVYFIGVDLHKNYLDCEPVIASFYSRKDLAVYQLIDSWFDNGTKGGSYSYGLKHKVTALVFNNDFFKLEEEVAEFEQKAIEEESEL